MEMEGGENHAKVKGDVVIMMKHDLRKMVLEEDKRMEKMKMGGNELKQLSLEKHNKMVVVICDLKL